MNRLRFLFVAIGAVILAFGLMEPVMAIIASLRDQIAVTIVVNVTPSPIAYVPHQAPAGGTQTEIAATMSLHPAPPALQGRFHAESLHFVGGSQVVAQVQNPLLVQAEVTPNPNATLLYSNINNVTINAIAGTTVQIPCAFTVTVDKVASWSLDEGLSNDFSTGFSGTELANNTYVSSATPEPTSTPYIVYADDGSRWSLAGTGTALKTYCVTLSLTVPGTVTAGTYSTNAVYSLYF